MEATYLKVVGSDVRTPGTPVRLTRSVRLRDSRPCLSEAAGDARQDPSRFPQSGPTRNAPPRRSDRARFARSRGPRPIETTDRKSTRLNSSHLVISYAVFCLKKKKKDSIEKSTS